MASCLHGFMLGVLAVLAVQSALYIFSPDIGQPEYGVRRDINADDSAEKSHYPVIIVGAGAAGLSLAGRLQHAGIPYIVFEKDTAGSAWDKRYARLHLHTVRGISELPYWHFPETAPTFVPRDYLAKYYRAYASFHNVKDHTEVVSAMFDEDQQQWTVIVRREDGEEATYTSNVLAVCTGQESTPRVPHFPGEETFPGRIFHSQDFVDGRIFRGQRVLVVGFGNSGSEMALDLWEWNAKPTILARSPVHMLPRSLTRVFGHLFPIMRPLPPWVHDSSQELAYKLIWGDLSQYNITLKKSGIINDVVVHHKAPIQDIGTMELIKKGEIPVIKQEIQYIDHKKVYFIDGSHQEFDHILLATGFQYATGPYSKFLPSEIVNKLANLDGVITSGEEVPHRPRLYFLGFDDYLGRLAEINMESADILRDIRKKQYV
eukprot:m.59112 g.59112  ORF g.59112 m.59112 type:complete len:431 (+) comp13206_c0_seq2:196-1488(+)